MKPLQFKVTNKAEYDDLMRRCEEAGYKWMSGNKPTLYFPPLDFPLCITAKKFRSRNIITWSGSTFTMPNWKIGQSLSAASESLPLSALEELCAVKENKDGSITISPELQAKLVVALRGGNHE